MSVNYKTISHFVLNHLVNIILVISQQLPAAVELCITYCLQNNAFMSLFDASFRLYNQSYVNKAWLLDKEYSLVSTVQRQTIDSFVSNNNCSTNEIISQTIYNID